MPIALTKVAREKHALKFKKNFPTRAMNPFLTGSLIITLAEGRMAYLVIWVEQKACTRRD